MLKLYFTFFFLSLIMFLWLHPATTRSHAPNAQNRINRVRECAQGESFEYTITIQRLLNKSKTPTAEVRNHVPRCEANHASADDGSTGRRQLVRARLPTSDELRVWQRQHAAEYDGYNGQEAQEADSIRIRCQMEWEQAEQAVGLQARAEVSTQVQ